MHNRSCFIFFFPRFSASSEPTGFDGKFDLQWVCMCSGGGGVGWGREGG